MARKISASGGLAAEIRQNKPFPAPEVEAYLNLVRTAGRLSDEVTALCKAEGISQPQYNVLRILRGAGEEGLSCGEVAQRMIHRLPDISRLLDRLEAARLVRKRRTRQDRRVVRVVISVKGLGVLDRLDRPLVELHRRQFGSLEPTEMVEINRLLVRLRST